MVDIDSQVNQSNGRHDRHSPVAGLAGRAANVASDLVELAELQARLAKADAQLAARHSLLPLVALCIGVCGLLASLPVLAMGMAAWLVSASGLNGWQSQLAVGAGLAAIAGATIFVAVHGIRRAARPFGRSALEFTNNVAWLKSVLRR